MNFKFSRKAVLVCLPLALLLYIRKVRNSEHNQISESTLLYTHCKVHDFITEIKIRKSLEPKCFQVGLQNQLPSVWVCGEYIPKNNEDILMESKSAALEVLDLLSTEPQLGLVDFGAHNGLSTMSAAIKGHPVLAIENKEGDIKSLHYAVNKNNVSSYVMLLQNNVISVPNTPIGKINDKDTQRERKYREIYTDDILEVIRFNHAIVKITSPEIHKLLNGYMEKFMETVKIYAFIVKWDYYRHFFSPKNGQNVQEIMKWMQSKGYKPWSAQNNSRQKLEITDWGIWPEYVTWLWSDDTDINDKEGVNKTNTNS